MKGTRIRDYNAVRFCVKANEANECSVRNQRQGKAEEIPTPDGGELELIECTIETCLFVEIKCVHYIANTRAEQTDTHMGEKLLLGRRNNIGLFSPSSKQVDNLTLKRVLHRELLRKVFSLFFFFLAPGFL